ncbi:acyl carrier protein [Tolypothrix sp. PCC 7910]|uniref:acyl carrier protein n=1 Tax=Tolypothrix sp. PCC 7910 TaxID=2099387 RepID=UPI001427A046|nr:acyl carrier protein [Tolypothrix sp. PCC 7910]QIR37152.1 acyl carrier protein [Tolypothrix sp. PCC 7910]
MKTIDLITEETKNIVSSVLPNISREDLSESSNLFSLGLDSVNAMTLVLKLQSNFGIRFAVNDINAENFQSIETIVQLINTKQS